jgi:hypothetical protein
MTGDFFAPSSFAAGPEIACDIPGKTERERR